MCAALALPTLAPAAKRLPPAEREVCIVVFRHHSALLEPEEVRKARKADAELLVETAREHCGGYSIEGGGSGEEMSLPASKLAAWKAAVDALLKAGELRYYSLYWGLDRHGYGLVSIR